MAHERDASRHLLNQDLHACSHDLLRRRLAASCQVRLHLHVQRGMIDRLGALALAAFLALLAAGFRAIGLSIALLSIALLRLALALLVGRRLLLHTLLPRLGGRSRLKEKAN